MRQVSAGLKLHPQNGVTRLEQAEHHNLVGRTGAVRLDVGVLSRKRPLGALDCQLLNFVNEVAAGMKTPAGVSFGGDVDRNHAFAG